MGIFRCPGEDSICGSLRSHPALLEESRASNGNAAAAADALESMQRADKALFVQLTGRNYHLYMGAGPLDLAACQRVNLHPCGGAGSSDVGWVAPDSLFMMSLSGSQLRARQ